VVDLDLDLPAEPGLRSLPPVLTFEQMIERIRQLRRWFPKGIPTAEERWQRKSHEPFRL
jgi:hypothetical protein